MHCFVNTVECLLWWETSGIEFKPLACLKVQNSTYFWRWPKMKQKLMLHNCEFFFNSTLSHTGEPLMLKKKQINKH